MPVLKMYHASPNRGDSPELWEGCWAHHDFEDALRFCAQDPLRKLFDRYVPPGSRLLEGGCGAGQYVAYYSNHGRTVVGIDFAHDALKRLRVRRRDLHLCTAGIEDLPLASASFDAYYSGGVVEHLEHGPEKALSEARRVLRDGGVLMCSVPFYNTLRRLLAVFGRRQWETVSVPAIGNGRDGRVFWQYAFTRAEFERLVREQGFDVVESMGYSILWGLYELPGVALLTRAAQRLLRRRTLAESCGAEPTPTVSTEERPLLTRLVVSEDVSVPVLGGVVRTLRATAANMMMFVCVKRPRSPAA